MTAPQLSTATLALEYLYGRIVAETLERVPSVAPATAPPISCVFGWRQAVQQSNQGPAGAARVVVQPGDATGKMGSLDGAKIPGRNPPPLATLNELATLFLWAVDKSDTSDLAQFRAARRLHDLVVPIVIRNFRGRWKLVSNQWLRSDLERAYGAEMQLVIAVEAMVPDDLVPEAPGGTVTTINGSISVNGGAPSAC